MVQLLSRRRLLVGTSALLYAMVFGALFLSEQTDLGIGRFFYLAIAVLALATGPVAGAAGGLLAVALYSIAVVHSSLVSTSMLLSAANGYRCVTYVLLGALVGAIAQSNRDLLARLRVLAECDPLTGLGNSRSFGNAIGARLGRGKPFALLIGDMDRLKEINDSFGHAVGDETLRQLARVLSHSLAPGDVAYRIGGDEFAVLAAQEVAVPAAQLAVRLEAALAAAGQSVSFGWAVTPEDGDTAIQLYRAADSRMYDRKRAGRHGRGSRLSRVPDWAAAQEA
jgi:diguanylate cyclase (GGDEF)-like protein